MTIDAYLLRPHSRKIFLAEIDNFPATIYLASDRYITEPGDTPGDQSYEPIIQSVPRLSRRIQELRSGRSMASYGDLVLSWYMVGARNLQVANLRGCAARLYVTGPRDRVARADAVLIFSGVVAACSGDADGRFTIQLVDTKAVFDTITLPPNRYASATHLPDGLADTPKPIAMGTCRNTPLVRILDNALVWQAYDPVNYPTELLGVDQVYSDGVVLTPTTDYTTDLAAGTVTLLRDPGGAVLTADVGYGGTATTVSGLITRLATTYGGAAGVTTDGFPGGVHHAGIYIGEEMTLADAITAVCQGCFGWWGVTRAGAIVARVLTPPGTPSFTITDSNRFGVPSWSEYPDIVYAQSVLSGLNYTKIESPAGSVSEAWAAFFRSEGFTQQFIDPAIKLDYPYAITAPPLVSYIRESTSADDAGAAVLTLLGTRRRIVRETTIQRDPPVELGDTVALESTDTDNAFLNGNYLVIGVTDIWDAATPLVELELLG